MIHGDFLHRVPLLRGLNPEEITALAEVGSEWECARGQTVFKEGDASDTLYIVKEGDVELLVPGGIVSNRALQVLGAGDVLGELSFLDQKPRMAGARCVNRVMLVAFTRDDLRRLNPLSANIQRVIYRNLARHVAARLRLANTKLRELAGRDKQILTVLEDVYGA